MTKYSIFVLLITNYFLVSGQDFADRQHSPYPQKLALEELKIIKHAIADYHPCPFRYISEKNWNQRYEQVKAIIQAKDSVNMFEFIAWTSPLISLLRDEHSNLYPKADDLKKWSLTKRIFPFEVSIADSSMVIRSLIDPSIDQAFVGREIVSINGRPTQEIVERLKLCGGTSASSDYSGTLYHAFNFDNFSRLYYLCLDQAEAFEIQFKSGEKQYVSGYNAKEASTSIYKLNAETNPEFHISADSNAAYLRISTFWPPAAKTTVGRAQKDIDKFFKRLKAHRTKRIVIDVRGNRGGTPFYATYLAGYFFKQPYTPMKQITAKRQAARDFPKQFKEIRKPVFSPHSEWVTLPRLLKAFDLRHREDLIFEGEVIVLVDAGTGSAASIFAGLMSESDQVRILGHETLGDANQTTGGQFKDFELPYSNLVLTIPLLLFQHGTNEDTYGVRPDSELIDQSLILSEPGMNAANK